MSQTEPAFIFLTLIAAVVGLLVLVLKAKIPPFFALFLVALFSGLALGLSPTDVISSIQNGMGCAWLHRGGGWLRRDLGGHLGTFGRHPGYCRPPGKRLKQICSL